MAKHTLAAIEEEGLETELIRLAGLDIRPCQDCRTCHKGEQCSIEDDVFPIYLKMKEADAIIMATPVYIGSATATLKALMDRTAYMSAWNGRVFNGKVGGPLVVARRGGGNFTVAQLVFWFHAQGLVVPGSTYWNIAFGLERGDVEQDEEGLRVARDFGKNVAMVTKKIKA
jgi:multimeric flavodoxin WrbA